jgi:hypothetical protein
MSFCARSPLFPQDGTHEHPRNELGQATGDPRTPSIFIRTLNAGQTTSDGRPDIAIERCTDANMRTKAQKRGKDGVKEICLSR